MSPAIDIGHDIDATILAANEFSSPRPVVAQMKYNPSAGMTGLLDGVTVRIGEGFSCLKFSMTGSSEGVDLLTGAEDGTEKAGWAFAAPVESKVDQQEAAVRGLLEAQLADAVFSSRWKDDGIQEPVASCKEKAVSLAMSIYDEFSILPIRLAPSVEEGVMLTFRGSGKSLLIELYNSGEAVGLISEGKVILQAEELEKEEDIASLVALYKGA